MNSEIFKYISPSGPSTRALRRGVLSLGPIANPTNEAILCGRMLDRMCACTQSYACAALAENIPAAVGPFLHSWFAADAIIIT